MAIDHPDGVSPISVSRADIKLPIDVQKQTINLAIDIVAQTLAKVEINLAASSITLDINIKTLEAGLNLNVNIEAQKAALNLNINIAAAAAAVTLNVNVKSQTANIDINIAANAITLNVNISSQTANINVNVAASAATVTVSVTGTANIDITAQSVAIITKADWEVIGGNQKYLYGAATLATHHTTATLVNYTVPAGKTLYLYSMSCEFHATVAANGDLPQHGHCYMVITASTTQMIGGNGGASTTFGSPIKVAENLHVYQNVRSGANHSILSSASMVGIEI